MIDENVKLAFVDELAKMSSALTDTARDHLAKKNAVPPADPAVAAEKKASGLHRFIEGAAEEALPVAGALVGSGVGKMIGANQLATSAAGYGAGGLADIALRKVMGKKAPAHAS